MSIIKLIFLRRDYLNRQILRRKNLLINKRDEALKEANDSNKRIEAYNRQLKDKFSYRYKDLDVNDNVLIIKTIDNSGTEKEL